MGDPLQFVLLLAVMLAVVALISAPLRRPGRPDVEASGDVRALEAARDAKYREIRDAEMDRRTGKLSSGDWKAVDGQLRAEAAEILRALDAAATAAQPPGEDGGSSRTTS